MLMEMQFPDLRQTFIADPGYQLFDIDLAGADARVVAWEADDEDLMDAFESGINVHIKNAKDAFPDITQIELEKHKGNLKESYLYDRIKRAVHATNYGAVPATLATKCSWSLRQAEDFQALWLYKLHPAILDWHERTEYEIQTEGRTRNALGDSIDWFSRPDKPTWRKALAWCPQSTVAGVAMEAQIIIDDKLPEVEFLSQVHDSLLFQIQTSKVTRILRQVKDVLDNIIVPYPRPLIIPWEMKTGHRSWGLCKKTDWSELL